MNKSRTRWTGRCRTTAAAVAILLAGGPARAAIAAPATTASTSLWISAWLPGVEGDGVGFTVTVSDMASSTVTVRFSTANGTAKAPDDYASASGKLTFVPGGPAQQTITVQTVEDASDEPLETLEVRLSHAVDATLGNTTATGGFKDDDFGPSELSATSTQLADGFQPIPIWCNWWAGCYWAGDWDPIYGVKTTAITATLTDAFGAGANGRYLEFWWQHPATGDMVLVCRSQTYGNNPVDPSDPSAGTARCTVNYPLAHPTGRYEVRFAGDAELDANSAGGEL